MQSFCVFCSLGFDWKRKAVEPGAVPEVLERSIFLGVGGRRTRTPGLEGGDQSDPLSGPHQDESKSYTFVSFICVNGICISPLQALLD